MKKQASVSSHLKSLGYLAALAAVGGILGLPAAAFGQEDGSLPSCHTAPGTADGVEVHTGHDHAAMMKRSAAPAQSSAQTGGLRIPDMRLMNQEGEAISFYSDLVKDKVVAMNFIFTTCTTVCPPMGANFSRLQDELGERLGRDVQLISISIDPTTDTPERLKAWGEKFSATEAWTFVTGLKTDVDQVLRQLEALTPDVKDHGPIALLVNDRTGVWRRVNGLTPPVKLAKMLDELLQTEALNPEEVAR